MPLTTNPQVDFSVGGEARHIGEGEIWEINNTRIHAVKNRGMSMRIHLIVDWTTDELIAQRKAITGLEAGDTPQGKPLPGSRHP